MRKTLSLTALLLGVLLSTPAPAARAADCVHRPESNGTGWRPAPNGDSLPQVRPRPGPDILYADPPRAPQLENTGIWKAAPIMVGGAAAYRDGEFVHQDFVWDDTALTYPADDKVYGGNAADLVEIRFRLLKDAMAVRLTYNTMVDPTVAATTIALGGAGAPRPMPHEAGAQMPAAVFVSVHGCEADADGRALASAVAIDTLRRQVEVRIPYTVFDPRGQTGVRVGAATGLWDPAGKKYLRPDSGMPAFFNVGFRFGEPMSPNPPDPGAGGFRDSEQNEALATGDLSAFHATVDFTKLARDIDDDMPGQPGGVPVTGQFSRIYPSRFETRQGRAPEPSIVDALYPGYAPCADPCAPQFAGRLQTYSVYVPARPAPARWGVTLFHHGCGETANSFIYRASRFADLDGGTSIAATNNARARCIWEYDQAGAEIFEMWADLASHYPLDADRVTLSGQSLGGYATWKNAVQFPDLFSAIAPIIAPPTASGAWVGRPAPPQAGEGTVVYDLLRSLRHVPAIHWISQQDELVPFSGTQAIADELDRLGYRHSYRAYTGEHSTTGNFLGSYDPMGEYIARRRVERDPARVTYVFSKFMHQPEVGLTSDHAYWLSGITLRESSGDAPLGTVDTFSHGRGIGDPVPGPSVASAGAYPSAFGPPLPYVGKDLGWGPAPAIAKVDRLDLTTTNLRSITVWPRRAGLSCSPEIKVAADGPLEVKLAGCDPAPALRTACTARAVVELRVPRGRVTGLRARVNGRRRSVRLDRRARRVRVDVRRHAGTRVRIVVKVRLRRSGRSRSVTLRRTHRLCGTLPVPK